MHFVVKVLEKLFFCAFFIDSPYSVHVSSATKMFSVPYCNIINLPLCFLPCSLQVHLLPLTGPHAGEVQPGKSQV